MLKIGLLGCGNIGRTIAKRHSGFEITAAFDKEYAQMQALQQICPVSIYDNFDNFIGQDFDLLVEAASIEAVSQYVEATLTTNKDIVILSVGAFANQSFKQHIETLAQSLGRKIHIPSGAVFGLDNLKVAQISSMEQVVLRTTKHPASLGQEVTKKTCLFHGPASECIKLYPRNVNVAVSISLAASCDAMVELWADPDAECNMHEIILQGEFGKAHLKIENVPSPDNPATSYLAALSVLSLLDKLDKPLQIGT